MLVGTQEKSHKKLPMGIPILLTSRNENFKKGQDIRVGLISNLIIINFSPDGLILITKRRLWKEKKTYNFLSSY